MIPATFRGLDLVCKDERTAAELAQVETRNPILADVLADALLTDRDPASRP